MTEKKKNCAEFKCEIIEERNNAFLYVYNVFRMDYSA